MTRALISLGTNTVRLLIVRDARDGTLEELEHAQTGTRLGEGLRESGTLAPEAIERTLDAVTAFVARAQRRGAELSAIATSAVRRANDGAAFAERVRAIAGVPLEILDGETEAAYSFRGATAGAPCDGSRIAVVDVGGGSTECAVGRNGQPEKVRSFEIGSVRLAEAFPALQGAAPGARARAAAAGARAVAAGVLAGAAELGPVDHVRAVAGSPATIAAVAQGSDVERVAGSMLTLQRLDATLEQLLELNLEARRALPGMLPQRADVIVGGGIVLSETLRALGTRAAQVERNDLLLGYLLSKAAAPPGVLSEGVKTVAADGRAFRGMMVESVDTADF
ncbi:MAG: hypothetical protein GIX03_09915 [Candidatus Eremiobacteraeota bacterium]|nr:hypothetical protein [Candidatus Eremiobacteraeota bacterium]MBC5803285.1 hypothetical protein [Candidatus Eremiobacteraeota bacterium]MBC5822187.1 hypothetical protein [Candidatus Eremiobacteraeota bacterium]